MATSSSTEYLPASLSFLIANFQSFVTVKLDSSNYFAWKTQIENALIANSLFDYATGLVQVPDSEIEDPTGNKVSNPAFEKWGTIDRMLMSCIIATVTPSVLPHIVGSKRTCEVWTRLEEKFSSLSRTHIQDLKCRIYSLKKTTSMEQYLDSIKVLVQRLEATGSHMEDEELVFHTLKGLPDPTYRSFKQAIRTRFETAPLTFSGLVSMLMAEDLYLDTEQVDTSTILLTQGGNTSSSTTPQNAAGTSLISQTSQPFQFPVSFGAQAPQFGPMYPQMPSSGHQSYGGNRSNRNYSSGQRSYGGNRNNRNYSMDFSFPPGSCQICGKTNHQASHCYHRQNLGYRPPQFGNQSGNQFGNQFGMSSQNQFGMLPQGSSSSQRPQAFMLNVDNFGNSNQGYVYSPYSPNLQQQPSYISQGYTHVTFSLYSECWD